MEITWFGTAALSFKNGDDAILFDPFIPMNEALHSPDIDELAKSGDIFITHGHFDHLIDVPAVMQAGNSKVYCSQETMELLAKNGVDRAKINPLMPGDVIIKGSLEIEAFGGAHIRFDLPLIIKTLFSRRTLARIKDLKKLSRLAKLYPEGRVLVYKITSGDTTVLHMGSLNLDPSETYPRGCDMLTLPFQGRSDLATYALQFIELLKPKAIYLHHFDDTFPPVSSSVDTTAFVENIKLNYPGVKVTVPDYKKVFTL